MLIADDQNYIICNRDSVGPWERFKIDTRIDTCIEMTAASKSTIVSFLGGRLFKHCTDAGAAVICNSDVSQSYETFTVEALGEQRVALRSGCSGKYCSDTGDGVTCTVDRIDTWEIFTWELV
jgi:hypothetical protein